MSSVSVIIPCYRYGHFLRECAESVLTQVGVDVRILILDDASPDNTSEVGSQLAKEDSRVTFVRHASNKGHIATYNEGMEWASSDYLLLLSADDYLLPGALSRASTLMDRYPEVGFTFGNVVELSEGGERREVRATHKTLAEVNEKILQGWEFIRISDVQNIVRTPTALVRTNLQKKVGGYRPELPHTGDMEMWLRLASHASVGFIGVYQAVYRRHSDNMSLGYMERKWSRDLQQRKVALECFFEGFSHSNISTEHVRRRMLRNLACEAIGFASAAFNDGEEELSEELLQFAVSVSPKVKRSLPWTKLALKRQLGVRRWSALRPVVTRLREW